MTITFKINGRVRTREQALAHFTNHDSDNATAIESANYFDIACQQSSRGYAYRDVVEESGVTIRHANEEQ